MEIQYAHSGDVDVAFRTLGEGPLTLIYVAGSFSNLEVMWEHPDYRRFFERIFSFARRVLFDKRGVGGSHPGGVGSLEGRVGDVRAGLDAGGAQDPPLP